jgi:hypothetical protein
MGPQPTLGIDRRKEVVAALDIDRILDQSRDVISAILTRPPPPRTQRRAIWNKSLDEQKDGWLSDWHTVAELDSIFGQGGFVSDREVRVVAEGEVEDD